IANREGQTSLSGQVVIAAHGSWGQGRLPTNLQKSSAASDLFGFKAHFRGASLARDLMPLLVFPGGYGGMVWADQDRISLSCCIRRDVLTRLRKEGG
ncbi:monooxygenase, partial [Mesorhizobium sp. M2E.F.Ca.ET.209.01.1.1]